MIDPSEEMGQGGERIYPLSDDDEDGRCTNLLLINFQWGPKPFHICSNHAILIGLLFQKELELKGEINMYGSLECNSTKKKKKKLEICDSTRENQPNCPKIN